MYVYIFEPDKGLIKTPLGNQSIRPEASVLYPHECFYSPWKIFFFR